MASSNSQNKNLELQATGEHDGTWGIALNAVISYIDQMLGASTTINTTGGTTNISTAQLQNFKWLVTGALISNATFQVQQNAASQNVSGFWMVDNQTTGAFTLTIQNQAGRTFAVPQGRKAFVYTDGVNVDPVKTDAMIYGGSLAGGTTTYTITLPGNITAYSSGLSFNALINATNSGTSTVNASALGARNVYRSGVAGPALVATGEMVIGNLHTFVYDTTLNAGAGGWHMLAGLAVPAAATAFLDTVFRVQDDGDPTKQLAFQCSGITTANTRVMTVPNFDGTLATLAGTESFSNKTLVSPTISTSPTAAGATWTDLGAVTTADINGGTVDGTVIGGASAVAGSFTSVTNTSLILNGTTYTALRKQGVETIYVPAGAMTATTTNGATPGSVETATNDIMIVSMGFPDGATTKKAQFTIRMPKSWNLGTVTAGFEWTANSTSTNSVVWQIRAVSLSDTNAIDTAFGTAVTVTDANGASAYTLRTTSDTGAMTIANTPASEDLVVYEVFRDPTNGSDNLAAQAELIGVTIKYTTSAADDS